MEYGFVKYANTTTYLEGLAAHYVIVESNPLAEQQAGTWHLSCLRTTYRS